MKRDLDLIRKILMEIEASPTDSLSIYDIFEKYNADSEIVYYQVTLLNEAGLIKLKGLTVVLTPDSRKYDGFKISRLTLSGHNYLDAIRTDKIWDATKKQLLKAGGTVSFELVTKVATKLIEKLLQIDA